MVRKQIFGRIFAFFQKIGAAYARNETDQMAAAFSFYAMLSLPSLIVLVVGLGSFLMGQTATKQKIYEFIIHAFDEKTGRSFMAVIDAITASSQKTSATFISAVILVFTATALFDHLIHALHTIWGTERKEKQKISTILLNKLTGLLFIVFIDLMVFLSFSIQNFLSFVKKYFMADRSRTAGFYFVFPLFNLVFSFALPFLFFLCIFKISSHAPISWKSASLGALVTSILYGAGNFLLGMYFQNFADFSIFGAANTMITILVWIYYTSQILFLGAEITAVISGRTLNK